MKTFILLDRILGVLAALSALYFLVRSFIDAYLPLFQIADRKREIYEFLWSSLLFDVFPAVIVCITLLLPYSRIISFKRWVLPYALLLSGTIYFAVKSVLGALNDSDVLLSLAVSAIPFCILIGQLSVILIARLQTQQAEQGAAANP